MLFNWLVVILFLQAYDYVNADWDVYNKMCKEKCEIYVWAQKILTVDLLNIIIINILKFIFSILCSYIFISGGKLCSEATGAQTFYCTLQCSQNSRNDSEYQKCKKGCTGVNLNEEKCRGECRLILGSKFICDTVCMDDKPASLPRCLFVCGEHYPPAAGCVPPENPDSDGRECENPNLITCAQWCYDGDWQRVYAKP
uniref:TIL domain-containing protein n=1 Tax=Trichobilharzia regenti TaxID=157069 RepID=A0AA85J3R2_TRIRE|nr:unnamed protein product [Trichobilharzia regenti]